MALDLTGIHNVGEFYSHHYLEAVLGSDLKDVLEGWSQREKESGQAAPNKRLARLAETYFQARHLASQEREPAERWSRAREFHAKLLEALGYDYQPTIEALPDQRVVPVLLSQRRDGRPFLWVVDAPFPGDEDDSPLDEQPLVAQLPKDAGEAALPEASWRELLDGPVFKQESPPRWVLFMGGEDIFLIDHYKWGQGKYLRFELGDLLSRRQDAALKATAALLHREVLNPEDGLCRHDALDEASHKHAFAVSTDLKYGARAAIELLGNEAVRYKREVAKEAVFSNDQLARQLTEECLVYLYRLLFLFYVEARGAELGVVPMQSDAFRQGYSLEALRDLELVPLTTAEARDGFFLHHSLEQLFRLVQEGFPLRDQLALDFDQIVHEGFSLNGLRSPIFDPARTPLLRGVKFRNLVVQQVLQLLSLSREGGRKERGRISYAQLGINQLGSVYEGLLSYSGFFAQEDLFEVRSAKEVDNEEARTFFVAAGRAGAFDEQEFVRDPSGRKRVHKKGSYLFRLAGRDREKSASFYTPEVLTRCLTKYTLRERLQNLSADEMLELTICEPAMGSGAFLNEAINQLAHHYLEAKQKELGQSLASDDYQRQWQKVKYHLAAHNCYGVDKNPRALELAKLSLWLNTLSKSVETPYLDLRLATGDSLIGCRRAVYDRKALAKKWLKQPPERVSRCGAGQVYHFLVPYEGMASFDKDKAVKELEPEALEAMKKWRKAITAAFTAPELDSLERISQRIDSLWQSHTEQRRTVLAQLRQPVRLWGQPRPESQWHRVDQSQAVAATLGRGTAAGRRLGAVMDYWCALWFWPLAQAHLLPSRDEWLMEVEALLDGDVDQLSQQFERFGVVREVTGRVRFVHWELAFAEVFAERGGFDIIVGNPPWVKVEWKEGGVLGDIAPELEVRGVSASDTAKRRAEVLAGQAERELYLGEYQEVMGTAQFLGAVPNYPLLAGQKNNLYKCFLVNNWRLLSKAGMQGLVHQPGVFDDPKGGLLRAELARRLKWVWQFKNELILFEGVDHQRPYCTTITAGELSEAVRFRLCSNLFHPRTLGESEGHDGFGAVPGIKDDENHWDLRGHRSRIVEVDEATLELFATLYDPAGTPALEARVPVVHSREILNVLRRFAAVDRRLGDLEDRYFPTTCLDETQSQRNGTIRKDSLTPEHPSSLILSGPHFFVGNPFNKSANVGCRHNQDYAVVDLDTSQEDYLPRGVYTPACSPVEFERRLPSWRGVPVNDYYRLVFREMVAPTGERTFVSAVVPKGVTHIHTVYGVCFERLSDLLHFAGLSFSIVFDFFVKSTGRGHLDLGLLAILPFKTTRFTPAIKSRALRLSALTSHYRELWAASFDGSMSQDSFTKKDPRLKSWSELSGTWTRRSCLRTSFERRQALVELDALAALSLGMSDKELLAIYRIQFPVLRMYEADTYYDTKGNIVFTVNRGLSGVGLTRKEWEQVKWACKQEDLPEFAKTFSPPFDSCNRESDLMAAYEAFSGRDIGQSRSEETSQG